MKKFIHCCIITTSFLVAFSAMAQEQEAVVTFTEENLKEQENKNMKWVSRKVKSYNMVDFSGMLKVSISPYNATLAVVGGRRPHIPVYIGYEKKLRGTQLSLELRASTAFQREYSNNYFSTQLYQLNENGDVRTNVTNRVNSDLIGRYYLLKNKSIREGRSGNNLFGLYAFAGIFNAFSFGSQLEIEHDFSVSRITPTRVTEFKGLNSSIAFYSIGLGYRMRFAKSLYFDSSFGYANEFRKSYLRDTSLFLDFTLGYGLFKRKK